MSEEALKALAIPRVEGRRERTRQKAWLEGEINKERNQRTVTAASLRDYQRTDLEKMFLSTQSKATECYPPEQLH